MADYAVSLVISELERLKTNIEKLIHVLSEEFRPDMAGQDIFPPELKQKLNGLNAGIIMILLTNPTCLGLAKREKKSKIIASLIISKHPQAEEMFEVIKLIEDGLIDIKLPDPNEFAVKLARRLEQIYESCERIGKEAGKHDFIKDIKFYSKEGPEQAKYPFLQQVCRHPACQAVLTAHNDQ